MEGRSVTVLGEEKNVLMSCLVERTDTYYMLLQQICMQLELNVNTAALRHPTTQDILPDVCRVGIDVVQIVSTKDNPARREAQMAFGAEMNRLVQMEYYRKNDAISIILPNLSVTYYKPVEGHITASDLSHKCMHVDPHRPFFNHFGVIDDDTRLKMGDVVTQI